MFSITKFLLFIPSVPFFPFLISPIFFSHFFYASVVLSLFSLFLPPCLLYNMSVSLPFIIPLSILYLFSLLSIPFPSFLFIIVSLLLPLSYVCIKTVLNCWMINTIYQKLTVITSFCVALCKAWAFSARCAVSWSADVHETCFYVYYTHTHTHTHTHTYTYVYAEWTV